MAKKPEKAVKVMELLNKNPDYANEYVAAKAGCHPTYVKQIRKKMAHADQPELDYDGPVIGHIEDITYDDLAELAYNVTRGKQGRRAKPGEYIEVEGELTPNEIDEILTERGNRYGPFLSHAMITQMLKNTTNTYLTQHNKLLMPDQQEALDMIFHKIGRILNGDPDYVDSWVDIAGYAKLVADRLQGNVR